MNIFTVLSQGKGRLNEENLSAMLGFLLSPTQTHGFGDTFLRLFLNVVAHRSGDPHCFADFLGSNKLLQAETLLESAYALGSKRRVVDLELQLYTRSFNPQRNEIEVREVHRIAIENKVKTQAADSEQLKEEFLGIIQDIEGDDQLKLTMVFLTPPDDSLRFQAEYAALDPSTLGRHAKAWLRWSGPNEDQMHLVALMKRLLHQEETVEVTPISDYVRHTLKAFIRHIIESPAGSPGKSIEPRRQPAMEDIIEVVAVTIAGIDYHIEQYESSAIRVYNVEKQEYEVAKPLLRTINTDKGLGHCSQVKLFAGWSSAMLRPAPLRLD
jgi:hypothetical protein